jgi:hypothetical protein
VIEQDDAVGLLEGRDDEAPHVLIAAEPVREYHRLFTAAANLNVIALADIDRR